MAMPDPDSVKMFIGQIPRTMEEDELKKMMEEYGPVYQCGIIRDRSSGQHRGKRLYVSSSFLTMLVTDRLPVQDSSGILL